RAAAHPFGVELPSIALRQRSILTLALAFRLRELDRKQEERAEKEEQHPDRDGDDDEFEIEQRRPLHEDARGDPRGDEGTMRQRERRKRRGCSGEKSESTDPVRVRGDEAQLDARNLPQEPGPNEQPVIPPQ